VQTFIDIVGVKEGGKFKEVRGGFGYTDRRTNRLGKYKIYQ
jgi:hypothetical protein